MQSTKVGDGVARGVGLEDRFGLAVTFGDGEGVGDVVVIVGDWLGLVGGERSAAGVDVHAAISAVAATPTRPR